MTDIDISIFRALRVRKQCYHV